MAFCRNCGNQLKDGAKFCPKCGNLVKQNKRVQQPTGGSKKQKTNNNQTQPSQTGWLEKILGGIVVLGIIGFLSKQFGNDKTDSSDEVKTTLTSEQTSKEDVIPEVQYEDNSNSVESESSDFFEKGYVYSASYSIHRNRGYGLSGSYNYKIKIYNDGTTEMLASSVIEDIGTNEPQMYSCEIKKESSSYRDVSVSWYEVKWDRSSKIYVDERGNIIELGVNGNNKDIYEAIATGDCVFGKFTKEELSQSSNRICKTCGKEYNPESEPIVSDDYCYNDYPQTCERCGKTYTINSEGNGACKGTCARCYERYQSVRIYERATGRKVY